MSNPSQRRSWAVPILPGLMVAVMSVLGILGSLIAAYVQVEALKNYWPWVLGGFIFLLVVSIGGVYWERARASTTPSAPVYLPAAHQTFTDLHQRYLNRIVEQIRFLPLRAVDFKTASAETGEDERLQLADVYIQLNTKSTRRVDQAHDKGEPHDRAIHLVDEDDRESVPLPALTALLETPRMVLLGDPGSGKSTFVNHIAFCLASHQLEADRSWLARLHEWPDAKRQILPVPIVLRELAAWLPGAEQAPRGVGLFQAYLVHWLNDRGLADFEDVLVQHLTNGTALLLLDGLDEVPLADGAINRMKTMIGDLPRAYPKATILVTCRVLSYQDSRWKLNATDWKPFELAELNSEQIDGFIQAWHAQLAVVNAVSNPDVLNAKLSQAVRRSDLIRLATNPLLLTVMALVHTHKGQLPDARSVLYEDVVDLLLWRWEAIKHEDQQGNETSWRQHLQKEDLNDDDVKEALWQLAYRAHANARAEAEDSDGNDDETTADISEQDLLDGLRELHPTKSRDWAAIVVEMMKMRAGLLVESQPRVYSFPHRTFQEYLAGCYLSQQPDFAPESVKLAQQGVYWREPIQLAVGRLVHHNRDIDKSLILVSELCPSQPPDEGDEVGWRQSSLAGNCLLEIGVARASRRHSTGRELVERVQNRLTAAMTINVLTPRERAEMGSVLSRMGDPRDLTEMIHIPGGPFTMGTSDEEEEAAVRSQMSVQGFSRSEKEVRGWIEDEKPQHQVDLPGFFIAKYPVTNGQYEAFVDATNHNPPQHWQGSQPPAELRNHPVVRVSWNDAVAYCQWISETNEAGRLYRLPSEAEWEKAARGTDKRLYPWWGDFDPAKCNAGETGIGSTSSVGLFPQGASPYGSLDMAGNVWEWCHTEYKKYPTLKDGQIENVSYSNPVLRGGAFDDSRYSVRCSARRGAPLDLMYYDVGFRVSSPGC